MLAISLLLCWAVMRSIQPNQAAAVMVLGGCSALLYAATAMLEHAIAGDRVAGELRDDLIRLGAHGALYVLLTGASFGLYYALIRLCRLGGLQSRAARRAALAFPVIFSAVLFFNRPALSIDVLTYIVHGQQLSVGANPYIQPAKDVAATPFGARVADLGWIPVHGRSPYGPLWTRVEHLSRSITTDLAAQILFFKALAIAFMLACGATIWRIIGRVQPDMRLLGTIVFLWNPVVVLETAGAGHNDPVMLLGLLIAILACLERSAAVAVLALLAGTLVKIVPLVFAMPQAVFLWRTDPNRRRLVAASAFGAAVGVAVALAAYAPFWAGPQTFQGLRDHGRPSILASTPGVLLLGLNRWLPEETGAALLSLVVGATFVAVVLLSTVMVHDDRSLLRSCGTIAIVYLLLAPGYWPWYTIVPITLLALTPERGTIVFALALTFCARLAAPLDMVRINGYFAWEDEVVLTTLIGLWLPALIALVLRWRQVWAALSETGERARGRLSAVVAPSGDATNRRALRDGRGWNRR